MAKTKKKKPQQRKLTRQEYIDYPAFSFSALKEFRRSPEHYKQYKEDGMPDAEYFLFGRALHTMVLEPGLFDAQFHVMDESQRPFADKNYQTAANRDWKKEQYEIAKLMGKDIISMADYDKINFMRDKLYRVPPSREILEYTRKDNEVAKTWNVNGIEFKSLEDISAVEFGADLKTSANADPEVIEYSIFKYHYWIQGGMYTDGYFNGRAGFKFDRSFFFIFIEKEPPYGVSVYKMSQEYLLKGIQEYKDLATQVKACIDADVWDSYDFKAPLGEEGIFTANTPYQLRD